MTRQEKGPPLSFKFNCLQIVISLSQLWHFLKLYSKCTGINWEEYKVIIILFVRGLHNVLSLPNSE